LLTKLVTDVRYLPHLHSNCNELQFNIARITLVSALIQCECTNNFNLTHMCVCVWFYRRCLYLDWRDVFYCSNHRMGHWRDVVLHRVVSRISTQCDWITMSWDVDLGSWRTVAACYLSIIQYVCVWKRPCIVLKDRQIYITFIQICTKYII